MNILSLFDGMSCGRIALDRANIKVNKYYASEIDKYAIKVSQANFPDIQHIGDVTQILKRSHLHNESIDLLLGGSPCQGFSFANGDRLNFDDPRSKLFWDYVNVLRVLKPKYFLLENVMMNQESQDVITKELGVEPILINSSLLSAQNRKRLYWTNIPFDMPQDAGIVLKDILQDPSEIDPKFFYSNKSVEYMERGNEKWQQAGSRRADGYTQDPSKDKSFTLTANFHKGVPYNYFNDTRFHDCQQIGTANDINGHDILKRIYSVNGKSPTLNTMQGGNREPKIALNDTHYRKLTPVECERLQTVPDNYTNHVSNTQRYKMLGNGWTIDIIAHILKGIN